MTQFFNFLRGSTESKVVACIGRGAVPVVTMIIGEET